jgi:hypothetical protein
MRSCSFVGMSERQSGRGHCLNLNPSARWRRHGAWLGSVRGDRPVPNAGSEGGAPALSLPVGRDRHPGCALGGAAVGPLVKTRTQTFGPRYGAADIGRCARHLLALASVVPTSPGRRFKLGQRRARARDQLHPSQKRTTKSATPRTPSGICSASGSLRGLRASGCFGSSGGGGGDAWRYGTTAKSLATSRASATAAGSQTRTVPMPWHRLLAGQRLGQGAFTAEGHDVPRT